MTNLRILSSYAYLVYISIFFYVAPILVDPTHLLARNARFSVHDVPRVRPAERELPPRDEGGGDAAAAVVLVALRVCSVSTPRTAPLHVKHQPLRHRASPVLGKEILVRLGLWIVLTRSC